MTQLTQMGEAELDAYMVVQRKDGTVEHFHVVNGTNVPISAEEYAQANGGI